MKPLILYLLAAALILSLSGCSAKRTHRCQVSIGIYEGRDPLHMAERPGNPILTPAAVTDRDAFSIADPFVVQAGEVWYLFFEAIDRKTGKGDLAVAESSDLNQWEYKGVVLSEAFHLSYPYVFNVEGHWYMIPESRQANGIRLYQATAFPMHWELKKTLIKGRFADSSIVHYRDRWWIFTIRNAYTMDIYWADNLEGPWRPHARNPIYGSQPGKARGGGRVIVWNDKVLRFAQDNREGYGHAIRAFAVDKLTPRIFSEHEPAPGHIIQPGGSGWRSTGMHQFDAHELGQDRWFAVVDGCGSPGATRPND